MEVVVTQYCNILGWFFCNPNKLFGQHNTKHPTELFTVKWLGFCYVNFTSVRTK